METSITVERMNKIAEEDLPSHEILRENLKRKSKGKRGKLYFSEPKCQLCGKVCANKTSLAHHIQLHTDATPFPCRQCKYRAKTKMYLQRHQRRVHGGRDKGHDCKHCGKSFYFPSKLADHMRVHTGEKPNKCDVCGKEFSSSYSLSTHKYIHTNEKPFKCTLCDYACRDSSTLRKHKERHLGMQKNHQCDLCPRRYHSKAGLTVHMREIHIEPDVRKFKCDLCPSTFKKGPVLKKHIEAVHKKSKTCVCPMCGTTLTNYNNLKEHMRRHLDERPFKCPVESCTSTFKERQSLRKHSRIHDMFSHVICDICGKTFSRKTRLVRHLNHHLPRVKKVKCRQCGVKFYTKQYLVKHMKQKHGRQRQRYECDMCGFVTHNKPSIVMHIKYGHNLSKGKCKLCGKAYKRNVHLRQHYWNKHSVRFKTHERLNLVPEPDVTIKQEPVEPIADLEIDLLDIEKEEPFEGFEATSYEMGSEVLDMMDRIHEGGQTLQQFLATVIHDPDPVPENDVNTSSTSKQCNQDTLDPPLDSSINTLENLQETQNTRDKIEAKQNVEKEVPKKISVKTFDQPKMRLRPRRNVKNNKQSFTDNNISSENSKEDVQPLNTSNDKTQPLKTAEALLHPLKTRKYNTEKNISQSSQDLQLLKASNDTTQPVRTAETLLHPLKTVRDHTESALDSTINTQSQNVSRDDVNSSEDDSQPLKTLEKDIEPPKAAGEDIQPLQDCDASEDNIRHLQEDLQLPQTSGEDTQAFTLITKPKETSQDDMQLLEASEDVIQPLKATNECTQPLPATVEDIQPLQTAIDDSQPPIALNNCIQSLQDSVTDTPSHQVAGKDSLPLKSPEDRVEVSDKATNSTYPLKATKKVRQTRTYMPVEEFIQRVIEETSNEVQEEKIIVDLDAEEKVQKRLRELLVKMNRTDSGKLGVLRQRGNRLKVFTPDEIEKLENTKVIEDEPSPEDDEIDKNDKIPESLKEIWKKHQCYVCFKLFDTKPKLIDHCKEHFDVCNVITLKKCPLCSYVTSKSDIKKHIKRKHKEDINISFMNIKNKDNPTGSKYYYDTKNENIKELEIIPSIKILNKKASMELDKKNRERKNKFVGKPKLVRKGKEWIVTKEKIDLTGHVLPNSKALDKNAENYLEVLKKLGADAKKKGVKMLYPCNKCDKLCQNLSALTLHRRRHDPNAKPFKPKGSIRKEKEMKKADTEANTEFRTAPPKPIVNNHKCDPKLMDFYEKNIKGSDIEFWQFLKIYNKMNREKVNSFKDLESTTDYGIHFDIDQAKLDKQGHFEPDSNVVNGDGETSNNNETSTNETSKIETKSNIQRPNVGKGRSRYLRTIRLTKIEYNRRLEIKNKMREQLAKGRN